MGILNSRCVYEYVKTLGLPYEGGYSFTPTVVGDIPIPEITGQNQETLSKIEDKVKAVIAVKAKSADTGGLEADIDNLVRDLYGLPAENVTPMPQQIPAEEEELQPAAQARQERGQVALNMRSRRYAPPQPVEEFNGSCHSSLMVA
jgi:hypothetical protein